MQGLSEAVRKAVGRDPVALQCIAAGIANYSEVARRVAAVVEAETGRRPNIGSVKVALARLGERLKESSSWLEGVESILAESALAVQDRIAVVTIPREELVRAISIVAGLAESSRFAQVIQSLRTATLIVAEEDVDPILARVSRVVEVMKGQAAVIIVSPRRIVDTPGVIAYITGFLASHGINISQIVSCYVDTILIVDSSQAARAYQLLHDLIEWLSRKKASMKR